jgi:hypothetical protein
VKAVERRRWGSDAKVSVVGLTFAMWVVAIPLLYHNRLLNGDGDLIRHIVIGRHILEHGPRFADPFSFTRPGEPFLAYEWLSQVFFASVHDSAGLPGVAAVAALLIASALALVVSYVRRNGGDPALAFVVGLVAAVMTSPHWVTRPHLFTFVGTVATLHLLLSRRRVLWLLPLFALWSNLHPGFLYALVMIAAWSAGRAIEDIRGGQRPRTVLPAMAAPFGLAFAGSLVNPFGWTLHAHALAWLRSDTVRYVGEFMPLQVLSPNGLFLMAVVGVIVIGLAARREWVGWPMLLVFGAATVGALAVQRNMAMFALFALPVAARALTPVVRDLPSWAFGRMRAEFARSDAPGWRLGVVATALLAVVLLAGSRVPQLRIVPTDFSAEVFPAAAVLHAREAGLEGRLLSEWTWGGYVLKNWPGQLLFVDSMADFFGDDLVLEYLALHDARPGWEQLLAAWGFSLALFPPDVPLVDELRRAHAWDVAYEDETAVLLVRAEGEGGLAAGACQPDPAL